MTSTDLAQWAAHRRAVVATVARRVPGVDPELAASRGLEMLCAELLRAGCVDDPVAFWTTSALDVAEAMAHDDTALPATTDEPPVRTVDLEVLGSALDRLSTTERQLLWDHHVSSRPVDAIADDIGLLPYAARRRLRRAENRLASSVAETHADAAEGAECRRTRASLHDFVRNRLLPHRRQAVEDHMVRCAGCTRAFVDVRESYWMLRAVAPVLLLGAATAPSGAGVAAGAGAAGGVAGWLASLGTRAAVVLRSAFTDPTTLAATVAGGLVVSTAVGTGTIAGTVGVPSWEPGTVSVEAADHRTAGRTPDARQGAAPRPAGAGPADLPGQTAFVPPGLAKAGLTARRSDTSGGVPPGLTATDGVPPGLTATDGVPPGQAKDEGRDDAGQDGGAVPPGLAKKDGVPPGLAKKDGVPPGLAKKDGVPPGQATKEAAPPGQAKKDDPGQGAADRTPPGQAKKDTPPGQGTTDKTPPGQAKKDTPPGQGTTDKTPPGQAKKDTSPGHSAKDSPPGQAAKDRSGSHDPRRDHRTDGRTWPGHDHQGRPDGHDRARRTSTS
ncbi:hypothetical protein HLB15_00010 [Promicromonospora citrea]|uniref:hypothetical protein n=1 Tax=Promicromonospora citrea TaxID=43677 RepID=UPI0014877C33|nr:hypothetical protein [Promicromonospora citrea]NNH50662.1 hypothetical protein [Promicromonospora citrea]